MPSIVNTRTTQQNSRPPIQRSGKWENHGGGITLNVSNIVSDTVYAGTPIAVDHSARTAVIVKTAVVYENASDSATSYKLKKMINNAGVGHELKVGDYIGKTVGGTVKAIATITYGALYDTITVATTLGVALTAGDVLIQQTSGGAEVAVANSLVSEETYIISGASAVTVSAIREADEIVKACLPYALHSANLTSLPAKITLI